MSSTHNVQPILLSSEDSYLQTSLAKKLISTIVRAFYDDNHIVIIDYLLQNGFLHDGRNMGKHLKLTTKICRKILTFLKNEYLVSQENVTGIVETNDTKRKYRRPKTVLFWYVNLNLAIKIISLRLKLMHNKILNIRHKSSNESYYVCPGYYEKRCHGYYTELEVQNCMLVDGQFLCRECYEIHCNNPNPPSISTYTLQLIDQQQEYRDAEQLLSRFIHQMSSKSKSEEVKKKKSKVVTAAAASKRKATPTPPTSNNDSDDQLLLLRPSIFDLLHKLKDVSTVGTDKSGNKIRVPITSHLPSENGAIEYIEDRQDTIIPNDNDNINNYMEPSSLFDRKTIENFNGLLYFNNPNNNNGLIRDGGQRFVLDLEFSTSLGGTTSTRRAFQQATKEWNNYYQKRQLDATIRLGLRNISLQQRQQQQQNIGVVVGNTTTTTNTTGNIITSRTTSSTAVAAAVGQQGSLPLQRSQNPAAAAAAAAVAAGQMNGNDDDDHHHPTIPRPAKMTCRNTTPYFLKSEFEQPKNNTDNNNIMNMEEDDEDDNDDNQEQRATDTAAAETSAAEAIFEANTANMMMMAFPDHNEVVSRSEYIQQFHSELNVVVPNINNNNNNNIGYHHHQQQQQQQQQQGVAATSAAGQNYYSSQYNAEINHPSNRQTSNSTYGSIGYWVDVDIFNDDDDDNKTHNSV